MVRYFLGDLEVVLVYIEVVFLWQICLFFFLKSIYKREEKELTGNVLLASGAFFLGFSLYKLFALFYSQYGELFLWRALDRIFLVIGALLFILLLNQIYLKQVFESDKLRLTFTGTLLACMFVFVSLYYLFSSLTFLIASHSSPNFIATPSSAGCNVSS